MSADLFNDFDDDVHLPPKTTEYVNRIILDTADHTCSNMDDPVYKEVCEAFLDADLAILGAHPDLYSQY